VHIIQHESEVFKKRENAYDAAMAALTSLSLSQDVTLSENRPEHRPSTMSI
jgi:hypothetical protein